MGYWDSQWFSERMFSLAFSQCILFPVSFLLFSSEIRSNWENVKSLIPCLLLSILNSCDGHFSLYRSYMPSLVHLAYGRNNATKINWQATAIGNIHFIAHSRTKKKGQPSIFNVNGHLVRRKWIRLFQLYRSITINEQNVLAVIFIVIKIWLDNQTTLPP